MDPVSRDDNGNGKCDIQASLLSRILGRPGISPSYTYNLPDNKHIPEEVQNSISGELITEEGPHFMQT